MASLLGLHDAARAKQAPRARLGSRAECQAYSGLPPAFGVDPHAGMVWIEAGMFAPGSREGYTEERPRAVAPDVAVAGFWIDRTEVTNAQFHVFVEATHYVTRAERAGESAVFRAPGEPESGQRELPWWHDPLRLAPHTSHASPQACRTAASERVRMRARWGVFGPAVLVRTSSDPSCDRELARVPARSLGRRIHVVFSS